MGNNRSLLLKKDENLKGLRFNKLLVLSLEGQDRFRNRIWKCLCDCGTEKNINGSSLKSKKTTSCGCVSKEKTINRNKKRKQDLLERLYRFIKKESNGCWVWTGHINEWGYGTFDDSIASRVSWILHNGPIEKEMLVCHNCPNGDNPACVNPEHLFLGTPKQNVQDAIKKNRVRRGSSTLASKLKEQDILTIFEMRSSGKTQAEIADFFGVNACSISRILNKKRWGHFCGKQ